MNAKATRMLLTAVALSALAAVLASFAQARIPEGNGTRPPSKTVVIKQQSLQELLASVAQDRIPEGNGTQPPSETVATGQQAQLVTGTFFFSFTPDPAIYVVYGALMSPTGRQAPQGSGTFTVDPKLCANLDRAIRVAVQECLSHSVPLAAKVVKTGTGQKAVAHKFPAGYRGLP
jgi:hypothetical protein